MRNRLFNYKLFMLYLQLTLLNNIFLYFLGIYNSLFFFSLSF